MVRWVVMSQTTALPALAYSRFTVLHLPLCISAACAQSPYAFGTGLATALMMFISGYLYGQFRAEAFLLMALLCVVALPVAFRTSVFSVIAWSEAANSSARF